jgi:hypothetical protein
MAKIFFRQYPLTPWHVGLTPPDVAVHRGRSRKPEKKELFSVVIFWSPDPLHVDWLGFSQLATGLNQQSSDTFFVSTRDTSSTTLVGGTLVSIA